MLSFLIIVLVTVEMFGCGGCGKCSSPTRLRMLMGIGVKVQQRFEATATSYNASFCGLTGKSVNYIPLTVERCECGWLETATYVRIAQVDVASNYPAVVVEVSYSDTLSPHLTSEVRVFSKDGGMCNVVYLAWKRKCNGDEMPFNGTVYVALPKKLNKVVTNAGRYTATITFTISPLCLCKCPCSP